MIMQSTSVRAGWRRLKIERHLDHIAAPAVLDEVVRAAGDGRLSLLVDLDAVDAADNHGIAALASAVRRVCKIRPGMRIVVLAHRAELADAVARALPGGEAEVWREPRAHACTSAAVPAA